MTIGLTWLGVLFCLSQSALFSGLNLALFSISKLELEVESRKGNPQAHQILRLRQNSNYTLVTILWGNVAVNVLLALLCESVLSGVIAFFFSTVVITLFAEVAPQAYFSRHALRVGAAFVPLLRVYQILLWPMARPTAWLLDRWLGDEALPFFRERDMRRVLQLHMDSAHSDIARVEGQGALNFLDIDDVPLADEGKPLDPATIISLPFHNQLPVFPAISPLPEDPFLRRLQQSGKSWIILVDNQRDPRLVLNANEFLREALFFPDRFAPLRHCHLPMILRDPACKIGDLIPHFRIRTDSSGTRIVENDVILLWTDRPRIITGTDLLGRLLQGIARSSAAPHSQSALDPVK